MPRYWLKPSGNIKTGTRLALHRHGTIRDVPQPLGCPYHRIGKRPRYIRPSHHIGKNKEAGAGRLSFPLPCHHYGHRSNRQPRSCPRTAGHADDTGCTGPFDPSFAEARSNAVPDLNDTSTRNLALKELHLARALYLCGDQDGIGEEVLRRYADGLQGHYARYAQEILNSK